MRQAPRIDRDAHAEALEDRIVVADGLAMVDAVSEARAAGGLYAEAHGRGARALRKLAREVPCGALAQGNRQPGGNRLRGGGRRKGGLRGPAPRDLDRELVAADNHLT